MGGVKEAFPIHGIFIPYILGTMGLVLYADIYYCPDCELREAIGVGGLIFSALSVFAWHRATFSSKWPEAHMNLKTSLAISGLGRCGTMPLALLVFLVGLACHSSDRHGIWCDPESAINGHAIWHVCGAIGILLIYLDLRCEDAAIRPAAKDS